MVSSEKIYQQQPTMEVVERIHLNVNKFSDSTYQTETVVLNIQGTKFEVYLSLLKKFRCSRFGELFHHVKNKKGKVEFFVDRNPACFGAILDYLRTGILHYPPSVCGVLFRQELQFWGIPERDMQKCCINQYMKAIETEEKLRDFTSYVENTSATDEANCGSACSRCRHWLWNIMTNPIYSTGAKIYCIITSLLLLANVVVIIMQSVHTVNLSYLETKFNNSGIKCKVLLLVSYGDDDHMITLVMIGVLFSVFFTIELIIRCLCAPSLKTLLTSVIFYIELLSLMPSYLLFYLMSSTRADESCEHLPLQVVRTLLTLRIIRMFRLFAALRFHSVFQGFIYTLKSSSKEILILFTLVMITTMFTGTMATIAEYAYATNEEDSFKNILVGIYWAVITASTVGYGDVVPRTPVGRVMTVFVALSGIVVIALATPMVAANFDVINTFISGRNMLENVKRVEDVSDEEEEDEENELILVKGSNVEVANVTQT